MSASPEPAAPPVSRRRRLGGALLVFGVALSCLLGALILSLTSNVNRCHGAVEPQLTIVAWTTLAAIPLFVLAAVLLPLALPAGRKLGQVLLLLTAALVPLLLASASVVLYIAVGLAFGCSLH
jgi:hypothetical protein